MKSQFLYIFLDQFGSESVADAGGIDGEVIVFGSAPCLAGVVAVIGEAILIIGMNDLLRLFEADAKHIRFVADAVVDVTVNENGDAARMISENVISAAADEDEVLFRQQVFQAIALRFSEFLVSEIYGECVNDRVHGGFLEEIRHFIIHAFFFGKAGETVLIVDGDVIVVREELSDGVAAAAALACDGDDHRVLLTPKVKC